MLELNLPAALKADEELHDADVESLEKRIMELALEITGAGHGAIFLYDKKAEGLRVSFHVVEGLIVTLPNAVLRKREDGRANGIAMWVHEHNEAYLCRDSRDDPHYAPYFLDVRSIAAVPIPYQRRAIGVLTVSSRQPRDFDASHLEALCELGRASAKFLRRAQLYRETRDSSGRPFLIKGLSPEWLEVERRLERVASTHAPVLIQGESGTGKDLVARAVHFNSQRSSAAFVTVNCAAIPDTMLESVLFGHVKGAFTGASFEKLGEFQKAHQGTLFLDEVGELPMPLQAKVLRAVEQGEVQPLGSNQPPGHVDVRLIAATNRDLPQMCRDGAFREDLYYRLGVMTMHLPPLRRYKDANLETLAHVFLQQGAQKHGLPPMRFGAEAMALLHQYDFPGNVRQLKNAVEHAAIMAAGEVIAPTDLPLAIQQASQGQLSPDAVPPPPGPRPLREMRELWLAPLERRYLIDLLRSCDGNVRRAAAKAGVNPVTMYRLLKKRGLEVTRGVAER